MVTHVTIHHCQGHIRIKSILSIDTNRARFLFAPACTRSVTMSIKPCCAAMYLRQNRMFIQKRSEKRRRNKEEVKRQRDQNFLLAGKHRNKQSKDNGSYNGETPSMVVLSMTASCSTKYFT